MRKGRINFQEGQQIGGCLFVKHTKKVPKIGFMGIFKCGLCESLFEEQISKIVIGRKKSCGCNSGRGMLSHGCTINRKPTSEYAAYGDMKKRCLQIGGKSYKDYGGRGIIICERWLERDTGFANFLLDMGTKPTKEHSLDRVDVNGNYEPGNCRWATRKEQNKNKRNNIWIEYGGHRKILADWAVEVGKNAETIKKRLDNGWAVETALTLKTKNKYAATC